MSSKVHAAPLSLLSANSQWAADVLKADPEFFKESSRGQTPHTLWIGCADSRVPESVITGSKPGDLFVHRNIANQCHDDDENLMSVIDYAVDYLGVEHVVIAGHTHCGGALACLAASRTPRSSDGPTVTLSQEVVTAPLNNWLARLTDLAYSLDISTAPHDEALSLLIEENVKTQVQNLSKTPTIVNAWANKSAKGRNVWIHGWVYDLATGKIKDLEVTQGPKTY